MSGTQDQMLELNDRVKNVYFFEVRQIVDL